MTMSTYRIAVLSIGLLLLAGCLAPSSSRSKPTASTIVVERLETLDAADRHREVLTLVDAELPRMRSWEGRARLELYRGKALVGTGRTQSGMLAFRRGLEELRRPEGKLAREIHRAWGDAAIRSERYREAARQYELALVGERLDRATREPIYYAILLALREIGDTVDRPAPARG